MLSYPWGTGSSRPAFFGNGFALPEISLPSGGLSTLIRAVLLPLGYEEALTTPVGGGAKRP
jgi:hypothetical protein